MQKQTKSATAIEEIVTQRTGAGDFRVTVQRNPETGWHATIYGRQPAEVHGATSWPTRSPLSSASTTN